MNHTLIIKCLLTFAILLAAQLAAFGQTAGTENVVTRWNRVLTETVRTPGQQPATIMPVRSYAMMHAAMFDAVNSIDGAFTPYLVEVRGSRHASMEAAAAQAAHDVLVGLYPARADVFAAELAASLEGQTANRVRQGQRVGRLVAARLLETRAGDGWNAAPPAYTLPATPGNWQPTPPANSSATFTHYPNVTPFAIRSATQFAPGPPPALTSAEYAADFNEVKLLGSATSATRTADQTLVARLWAGVGTPTNFLFVWNNVARSVADARELSLVERARLFALTNIALHDALQTTFASKFQYGLWRPVTAIRRADEDSNPSTENDPNWTSLVGSPPYPSYAGNNAAIGTSQSTMLALVFGRDDIAFQHTWEGAGGATRAYSSFAAMADEEANSRIYAGIHFRFDNNAGQSVGRNVANYIYQNIMQRRECVR